MWRYLAGGVAALLMVAAGWLVFNGQAQPDAPLLPARPPSEGTAPVQGTDGMQALPAAPERSREQKRFDRYDKDRDSAITRTEYLEPRRKAFTKLDVDGDGRLSFDEWAKRTLDRFAGADKDKSGAMNPAEFAATAPKRRATPACRCPASTAAEGD